MRNNVWVQNLATISGTLVATVSGNVFYIGNTADNRTAGIVGMFDDAVSPQGNGLEVNALGRMYDQNSDSIVRMYGIAHTSGLGFNLKTTSVIRNANDVTANVFATDSDTFEDSTPGNAPNALATAALAYGVDDANSKWARLRVTPPVGGRGSRLMATMSGDKIGIMNDGANNVVKISGQNVYSFGSQVVTTNLVSCAGTSGGTQLPSQQCINAKVRNLSGNLPVFVGGVGSQAPFSGKGQILYGGESRDYDINNFDAIRVFAVQAGQQVSVDGVL